MCWRGRHQSWDEKMFITAMRNWPRHTANHKMISRDCLLKAILFCDTYWVEAVLSSCSGMPWKAVLAAVACVPGSQCWKVLLWLGQTQMKICTYACALYEFSGDLAVVLMWPTYHVWMAWQPLFATIMTRILLWCKFCILLLSPINPCIGFGSSTWPHDRNRFEGINGYIHIATPEEESPNPSDSSG